MCTLLREGDWPAYRASLHVQSNNIINVIRRVSEQSECTLFYTFITLQSLDIYTFTSSYMKLLDLYCINLGA